jgi:uncharacterized protein
MTKVIIFLIRIYQLLPLQMHKLCRFEPTCSEYTIEALNKYGLKKGLKLGFKRIMKCHPGGDFGIDNLK